MKARRAVAGVLLATLGLCGGVATAATGYWPTLPGLPRQSVTEVLAQDLVAAAAQAQQADGGYLAATPSRLVGAFTEMERIAVRVRNIGCATLSTGSGFAIDEYTLITNRHVVEGAHTLQVSTHDGHDLTVTTAAHALVADLAIVRTAEPLPAFPRLAEHDPRQGEAVTVVGFPVGGRLTTTAGVILGQARDPLRSNLNRVLATDAEVAPGSSGSPVFNEAGEVAGVVYAKSDTGITLFVPVSTLREVLADEGGFQATEPCQ